MRGIKIDILLIGLSILAIVTVYAVLPLVHSRWVRFWLNHRAVSSKILVLTFDDGPGWRITPKLLDMLSEYNVKATFFLLGRNIVGREAIVRRIAKEGHEICSHGYNHLHSWKVPPWRTLAGIKSGWRTIDAALDSDNRVYPFRPPYGKLNLICLLYLWMKKVPIIYWTLDSCDTGRNDQRESRMSHALSKATEGAVLLMHDFDRDDDSVNKMVLKSVRSLLARAKATGIPVLTVQQFYRSRNILT